MKKLLLSFVIFSLLLAACENPLMTEILEFKTVKYNSNGGSSVPSQDLIKGRKLDKPDDPVMTDFLFVAWFTDNETFLDEWDFDVAPSKSMTLHAKWKPVKKVASIEIISQPEKLIYSSTDSLDLSGLAVTLIYDDDTEEDAALVEFASKGITTVPAHGDLLSRSTHNGQPVTVSCDGVTALTENLIVNPVVKFIADGGTPAPDDQYVDEGGKASEPEPMTKTGYTFVGWYKEAAFINLWDFANDLVSDDITIYARWETNSASITLSVEDIINRTPSMGDITVPVPLSKAGNSTQTIELTGSYSSLPQWKVAGVGESGDAAGSGYSFLLDANAVEYGTVGDHTLMLTVYVDNNPYMINIRFKIGE